MKPDATADSFKAKRTLAQFNELTLRQLRWLHELNEHGQPAEISRHFEGVSPSMLSRDLKALSEKLGIPEFYRVDQGVPTLTPEAQKILNAFEPLLQILEDLETRKNAGPQLVRVGCGGSLLAWLIGPNSDALRSCFDKQGRKIELVGSPLRNRKIIPWVLSGALEFGLVRASLLEVQRENVLAMLGQKMIGEVTYSLAVPESILFDQTRDRAYMDPDGDTNSLSIETQSKILRTEYVATVGPEGEFWVRFSEALQKAGIELKGEFLYRSFPQTLPHLLQGTHVAVLPAPPKWNLKIPGCRLFPLKILESYRRKVAMIWNKEQPINWMATEDVGRILSFW